MYRLENLIEYELDLNDVKCPKCASHYIRNFYYMKGDYIVGYKKFCNECGYFKEKIL